jgi:4-hydroxy-3-methylbut-2-enyl diphosphate reductase
MEIKLAEHYGLCFGVRDAIAKAEQLAGDAPLTILGELVHNPVVRERLESQGVREGRLSQSTGAATHHVMITAHGASDAMRAKWIGAGHALADATCPLVKHAHSQLRHLVELGYFPIVIGKHGHVEVQGLTGDFAEACVIETTEDIGNLPARERYGVVSQTTQPVERVKALVAAIRQTHAASEVRYEDTVCQPTKNRQTALRKLIEECDTLVVVGGRNSNNTLQLVAAAISGGATVFHIERPAELEPAWFAAAKVVGITAGTSTLKESVAAVHSRIEEIAKGLES